MINPSVLDRLQEQFPDSSKRTLQNWIKRERVYLDGIVVEKPHQLVLPDQEVTLGKKEKTKRVNGVPILYEDRWMIIVNKPAGLLSVPAENSDMNLLHVLREGYRSTTIFPVHRLDRESSGVLLLARGRRSEETFDEMFAARALTRIYFAIVEGRLPQDKGTWESFLREKENYDMELTTEGLGKKAITHFEVIKRSAKFSYLRLQLETGRKHQIRLHCASAGYPIAGDSRYGAFTDPIKRLCLHAYSLSFIHPFTQKPLKLIAEVPSPFQKLGIPPL
ncbi:MAG: Ribosomal large subunit pseudouridine synthase D [Chlamydiae bacterium]|nr:Ribosomal large subunit pseudouridine synthase D [Chlamydiota bacterium]